MSRKDTRCTGHCCKRFTLPYDPDELVDKKAIIRDGEQISGMAVHLESNDQGHFYTCLNLQPGGDCGVYEARPRMCRNFPYGKACPFPDCTMTVQPVKVSDADV